ncbi:MAG: type IV pilus twitching motility protein PilT [Alphaproteobacteria bacterium]|jgi:twitching motility protein PilT|nr:type IV pilus twitching motility protein PilT [Alphaproteobacteria bacterium]MCB1550824.1 type IV pilus twitching motility protein PilT [Alphaproteobacteria bacterium]MCB9985100.1 type IV pilus twitching motility protein PilT [Micavibrio sp.]HPQ50373.1 type IV pilus twitching motility protein PilT [Alphaproteobacteria bacterium]HRK97482.1 type IV pilus twitching motility protein PilT [Alphaproteobacteria bacterium]
MDITQLLAFVMQNNASDLHLSATNPPIVRVYGTLKRLKSENLSNEDIRGMLYSIMTDDQRADYEKNMELDFAISFGEKARFRVNAFTNRNGAAAVFRTIPSVIPTMEDLDLPPIMRRFSELEKGIVLVTGPTGSGKSTTLASMINHINDTMPKHILTVEDPVEFFHSSKKALVNHRELGTDTMSFNRALKSALREDPDVILVGEMRDHETISLALTAAETGHLVFGTLHSNSASKTIDRIIDVFPTGDKEMIRAMLSSSLQGVIAQTLLKRKGGEGRVAAFEVLVGTNAVRNLIRENQIPQMYSMIQTGSRYGMITMEDSIGSLMDQGIVDEDEARAALMKATDEEGGDRDTGMANAAKGGASMRKKGVAHSIVEDGVNSDEGYSF